MKFNDQRNESWQVLELEDEAWRKQEIFIFIYSSDLQQTRQGEIYKMKFAAS